MEPNANQQHVPSSETKPLPYVAFITFPRSGHSVTRVVLERYFDGRFRYCEFYTPDQTVCCKNFPCSNAQITSSKNHDLPLASANLKVTPKLRNLPHLVMYRNFLDAATSEFERRVYSHPEQWTDSLDSWLKFSQWWLAYYQRFVKKWVLARDGVDKLVIRYEDLTSDPLPTYSAIVRRYEPTVAVDVGRLQQILDEAPRRTFGPQHVVQASSKGIRNQRSLEEFRFFNRAYFAQMETQLAREYARLGYPFRYASPTGRSWIPGFAWLSLKK